MAMVLKVSCQGQTHRIPFDSPPLYAAFDAAVKTVLPTCGGGYWAKYKDEEGDLCTLVEPTFSDFLTTGKGTPAGQVSFRVEVVPFLGAPAAVSPMTMPLHVRGKPSAHRQKQPPKIVWVDDRRDLDKLVQQFVDEPVMKKKKSRKKPKKSSAQSWSDDISCCEEDSQQLSEEAHTNSQQVVQPDPAIDPVYAPKTQEPQDAHDVDMQEDAYVPNHKAFAVGACVPTAAEAKWKMDPLVPAVCRESNPGEHAATLADEESQSDSEGWETDEEMFWDMREPSSPRKASSCPCLPTQEVSLVAQAWPFVDYPLSNLRSSPATTGFTAQQCSGPTQEVVWMPVYINWWTTDSSIAVQ